MFRSVLHRHVGSYLPILRAHRGRRHPIFLARSYSAHHPHHLLTPEEEQEKKQEECDHIDIQHFRLAKAQQLGIKFGDPIYAREYLNKVKITEKGHKILYEHFAFYMIKLIRVSFDVVSRYKGPGGRMSQDKWLFRCIFLETLAGVPGMVAGMCRHLRSLRRMRNDPWIHDLLGEAENERMHLLIFLNMEQPGWIVKSMVLVAQMGFFNWFLISYIISPRTCHRFVGYLEEEAVKTYTGILEDIGPNGHLKEWGNEPCPAVAKAYYRLPTGATVYQMMECIRADEAEHRDINHLIAEGTLIANYKSKIGDKSRNTSEPKY